MHIADLNAEHAGVVCTMSFVVSGVGRLLCAEIRTIAYICMTTVGDNRYHTPSIDFQSSISPREKEWQRRKRRRWGLFGRELSANVPLHLFIVLVVE